jgi:ribonuclease E
MNTDDNTMNERDDSHESESADSADSTPQGSDETTGDAKGEGDAGDAAKKKRRRSRRGGRGRRKSKAGETTRDAAGTADGEPDGNTDSEAASEAEGDEAEAAPEAAPTRAPRRSRAVARAVEPIEKAEADVASSDDDFRERDELAAEVEEPQDEPAEAAASDESDEPQDGEDAAESKPRERRSRDRRPARQDEKREEKREKPDRPANTPFTQMLINYVPGEECRVAIMEDGKLEELHVERFASASRVGNIYVGRVMNVEPAIQAAFVDFGVGENGFLHVTDLHPRYFPGEDDSATERVGLKTPRRERPPIQTALRKGDEIIVQVLKEGVGTKGPTLTSYLSIPGRFLVMMPNMDKVGVSRKVEDEEERRAMREILDQLDLPEGFGFILRTAGMSRTKAELKRDLAYLMRLWKDMEKRRDRASGGGSKARLLYSESDLLVRALRDILTNETHEIAIDNEMALKRAAKFLKIVAPRTSTKLLHYNQKAPMFHAYSVENQISLIHAREVPLPSGGRLVIDQTEALVAIDVNSGRSRDSRDSETNAYQTNIEAVDEICRQLRLRDMGGIVINDLIDMRSISHRKDIENRFKERMKRDRAKSTVLQISEFGILQMTRQRMRASHESVHFTDCPTCRGRGMLQKPDSVAGDALRELSAILDLQRVAKVEMVVAPRVAGDLLSTKRQLLSRIERTYGKHVDVRVSESVPVDRITFYAYDETGSDIDLSNLPMPRKPRDLPEWIDADAATEADWAPDLDAEAEEARRNEVDEAAADDESYVHPIEIELPDDEVDAEIAASGGRRGRAGGNEPRDDRAGPRTDRGERSSDRGDRGGRRGRRGGRGRDDRREEPRAQPDNRGRSEPRDNRGPRDDRREPVRRDEPRREEPRRPEMRRDEPRREESRPQGRSRFNDDAEWGEPAPAGSPPARNDSPDAPGDPLPPPQTQQMPREARENEPPRDNAPRPEPMGDEAGEQGEGGRRKRRRRRRRGRGRGEGAPMENGAPRDGVNAPGDASAPLNARNDEGDDFEGDDEPRAETSGADRAADTGDIAGGPARDSGGRFEAGPGRGGDQGEGGRRRRRRGRGGRGGDRPAGPAPSAPRERRDEPPREQRPQPRPEVREPKPVREPPPVVKPPTPAASTPKPPPRTLYGAVRRKLTPGELKNRPKDD